MENERNLGSNQPELESEKHDFHEASGIWINIKNFVSELLDIRHDTDRESTVEAIKKDISFKGHNAWILVFSIFVASIGLNVGSTAVVIGAMLISPLMGPIVGVGLSVAINDVETLKKSFINLGVMVILSVLTAYIYFAISPVKKVTPELIARTFPTILDVLVAIFGGLALIVAKTKRGTIASVIFGVAIATALMPPLCTVGYGLAVGNLEYWSGALYLFSINAVFIALSTFVVVKLLDFPLVKYANSKRRKRIAQIASVIALTVMIPSVFLFVKLLSVQLYESKSEEFLANSVDFEGTEIIKSVADYKEKKIEIYLIGNMVPSNVISGWETKMNKTDILKNSKLIIHQGQNQLGDVSLISSQVKSGILEDLYLKNQEVIENKDKQIEFLENELIKYKDGDFSFKDISAELKANYDNVETLSYANMISTDFSRQDTIPTFTIRWKKNVSATQRKNDLERMQRWLDLRLKLDKLRIQTLN